MQKIFMLLLLAICCQTKAQKSTEDALQVHRLRSGMGVSFSSATCQLKDYLEDNGFGDKGSGLEILPKTNFPQSLHAPFIAELTYEYKLGNQFWVGLSVGIDRIIKVEGFDKKGSHTYFLIGSSSFGQYVTIKHFSWFLSPQISADINDHIGFFGGPILAFQTSGIQWGEENPMQKKKATKFGTLFGIRLRLVAGLECFAAYRFSSNLHINSTSNTFEYNGIVYTSMLPDKEIKMSHLRAGFTYRIAF